MRTSLLLVLAAVLSLYSSYAQRICGSSNYQQRILQSDALAAARFSQVQQGAHPLHISSQRDEQILGNDPFLLPVIKIPVVVHVLYNTPEENISDDQIASQIESLNRDFSMQSEEISSIPAAFAPLSADCRIRFQLATVDPEGRVSNGIIRKKTGVQVFRDDDKIKYSNHGGDDAWDSHSYLNIWVGNLPNTLLGYGSFPGVAEEKDGIVIRWNVFGTRGNLQAPFVKGRTLTHELGHWLNLKHPWGDTPCGEDDVDDTPKQKGYHTGCPSFPQQSAGCNETAAGELYMNFMDFTDDACMYMFTLGQRNRMLKLFETDGFRHDLLFSKGMDAAWNLSPSPNIGTHNNEIAIYPNPVSSGFTIVPRDRATTLIGEHFTLYNAMGQELLKGTIQNQAQKVMIASMKPGIYFIKLGDGKDNRIARLLKN